MTLLLVPLDLGRRGSRRAYSRQDRRIPEDGDRRTDNLYDGYSRPPLYGNSGGQTPAVEHCLDGQDGWQLYGKIAGLKGEQDLVFSKPTFGSYELGEYLHTHKEEYGSVEFVGVVTDICVISNIVVAKAAMPEVPIIVDVSCVASNDPKRQEAALCVMESIHVEIKR